MTIAQESVKGGEAKRQALQLLADDASFRDELPEFDYDESGRYLEFDVVFPSVR